LKPVEKITDEPAESIVFVVDDDPSMRRALGNLIQSVGFRVEVFSSAQEFLSHKRALAPACLVLDVRLKGLSGLELQRELAAADDAIPIIFITGHGDIPMAVRAMKAGAVEFLSKPFRDQDLLDAIHQALEQSTRVLAQRLKVAEIRARYETLTPREREVMDLVALGLLNKQIAGDLGASEATVKIHRAQVMLKMQAESLPELVRMVETLGVADRPTINPPPQVGRA
jgi:FixJ family two-component response regulator